MVPPPLPRDVAPPLQPLAHVPPAAAACDAEHAGATVTSEKATILAHIDDLLEIASELGYPTWHTTGTGGYREPWPEPGRVELDFETDALGECARLDMLRGVHPRKKGDKGFPSDDKGNEEWAEWLAHLCKFEHRLRTNQNPTSLKARANAVEMIVGLAYAAYMCNANLPTDHRLEWRSEASRMAWAAVWMPLVEMGVTVHREINGACSSTTRRFELVEFKPQEPPPQPLAHVPPAAAVQVDTARRDALEQAQIGAVIAASLIEVGSIDLVPDAPQREAAPEQPFASAQLVPPADVADVTVEYRWYRQPPLAPMVESDPRPAFGGHTRGQKPCVEVRDPIHHKTPSDWLFDQLRRGSRDQDIRNYIAAFGATQEEANFQSAVLELLEKVLVKRCTPRGPPRKKLLLDIREKVRGFDPGRARLQGGTMPELISGVDALPGVGVRFDADWTNVSAIMGMLEKCEVAEPCDHTGNWKLVHSIMADFQRNLDPTIH